MKWEKKFINMILNGLKKQYKWQKPMASISEANGINIRQPHVASRQQHQANTDSASESLCDYYLIVNVLLRVEK